MIENVMEHLASVRQEDPLEFRLKNMNPASNPEVGKLKDVIDQLRASSDYETRRSEVFLLIILFWYWEWRQMTRRLNFRWKSLIAITDGRNEASIWCP